jgi:hypothetical protein
MAREVLSSIIQCMPHGHHNRHDLESCVYVLVYAVMKKEHVEFLDKNATQAKQIKNEKGAISLIEALTNANKAVEKVLVSQFGHTSFCGIRDARCGLPEAWKDFLRWTTGSQAPQTNLHMVISALVDAVNRQNLSAPIRISFAGDDTDDEDEGDQEKYRGSAKRPNASEDEDCGPTKRSKVVQEQSQPLDTTKILKILRSAVRAEKMVRDAGRAATD